jgi:phospholipid/cholesterol/gamma-HCH transport system substrate-binding protein
MGGTERAVYRVRFAGSVSGLVSGSPVMFNGVRVGEVTGVSLNADDPNRTTVIASIERSTPLRTDTKADVETPGLLGAPSLSFRGGSGPPLRDSPDQPPTLEAGAAQDLSAVAKGALQRFDGLIGDNADGIKETIENLRTFTGALARNSDKVDNILASLERLGGGGSAKATPHVYKLDAPAVPALENAPSGQLQVSEPTAIVSFDTQKIIYRTESGEAVPAEDGQWGDTIPKLLHAKIIQTFENANYMRVVRPTDGVAAEFQLLLDVRSFEVSSAPQRLANVELTGKLVADGKVLDGRMFHTTAPVKGEGTAAAAAGLNDAFGEAATELVKWVASTAASHQADGPATTNATP